MIEKDKFVTLTYEMRTSEDGEIVDQTSVEQPLKFICGQGQIMEFFESQLLQKKAGEKFDFRIPMTQAYGERNEEMLVELPKDIFKDIEEEKMFIGNVLPMMDSMGRRLQGQIKGITNDEVTVDFNHPLAGSDIFFKGEVIDVREATVEELEALKSHGCGGGCGGCGGGCGSGCDSHSDSDSGCGGCGSH